MWIKSHYISAELVNSTSILPALDVTINIHALLYSGLVWFPGGTWEISLTKSWFACLNKCVVAFWERILCATCQTRGLLGKRRKCNSPIQVVIDLQTQLGPESLLLGKEVNHGRCHDFSFFDTVGQYWLVKWIIWSLNIKLEQLLNRNTCLQKLCMFQHFLKEEIGQNGKMV